jgi:alanyl-tRNA synthetase
LFDSRRYWLKQPWQTELTTEIKALLPNERGITVITDRTLFFPGGGGQPEQIPANELLKYAALFCKKQHRMVVIARPDCDTAAIAIACSKGVNVSASELIHQICHTYNGKGGGNQARAQGSIPAQFLHDALHSLPKT